MKKLLLFLSFVGLTIIANAQTSVYHPMPDSNAVWCENYFYTDGYCEYSYHYSLFMKGDTLFGGYNYHKLYRTGFFYSTSCPEFVTYQDQFYCLLRQDIANKKVYTWYNGDSLLYDFNLYLHDTLSPTLINSQVENYVSSIDSILVNNNYRKRFWLSVLGSNVSTDSAYVALIEGEGSTFGLMSTKLFPPFEAGGILNGFSDTVHYNHAPAYCGITVGVQELLQAATIQIYPNPTTNIITIESLQKSTIEILNIQGQTIQQQLIQQGKTDIDISGLAKGVYLLRLNSNNMTEATKFVKE